MSGWRLLSTTSSQTVMLSMMTGCQANHLCQLALSFGLILISCPSRLVRRPAIGFRHLHPCEAVSLQWSVCSAGSVRAKATFDVFRPCHRQNEVGHCAGSRIEENYRIVG